MKDHALSARFLSSALCLLSLSAIAATEEHFTRHFTVHPGGRLVVAVEMGSVDVSTNGGNEVVVEVWRKIARSKQADEAAYLKDHPVEISQDGDTVSIRCQNKAKSNWSWNLSGRNQNEAKYTIQVPARFNARLETSGGGISVNDLDGEVKAQTSAGSLHLSCLRGPLDGDTSGGGIQAKDCEGKLKLNSSAGGITVAGGSGSLKAETSGGSVTVKSFRGPANLETSAGGITLEDVSGEIRAETSGGGIKASLPAPIAGPIKLESSVGGITLRLPADAAFNLDAETSAGGVSSELPVTVVGKSGSDRLKGSVNGGGPPIFLRTSAGSIHLLKSQPILAEESK